MSAQIEKCLEKAKEKFDWNAVLVFSIDPVWFPNESYIISLKWGDHTREMQFQGTSFAQALTKLESFLDG